MTVYCRIPLPVGALVPAELVRWVAWANRYTDMDVDLHQSNTGIATTRNQICERFLHTDCSHVWMIDGDVVCPKRVLDGAWDIASGVYHHLLWDSESGDPPGVVWSAWSADKGGYAPMLTLPDRPIKVDAVGAGCLRISRRALEAIPPPWFEDQFETGTFRLTLGEDFDFCEKARRADMAIWIEPKYQCHHMKNVSMLLLDVGVKANILARARKNQRSN
uniref:Putative glycosyltransferase n=1 Tax=viral metagenome TaxID=1070528 RepID=A0A6M3IEH0_9ZZZZ